MILWVSAVGCAKIDRDARPPRPEPLIVDVPAPAPATDPQPPGEVPTTILWAPLPPPAPKPPAPPPIDLMAREPSEPAGRGKLDDRSSPLVASDLDISGDNALDDLVPEKRNAFSARRRPR